MTFHRTTSHLERVEQAIAYGRSDEWIRAHLGASDKDIARAELRIEAANSDEDVEQPARQSRRTAA